MLFVGANGCGKTHLASAIANYRLERSDSVCFATVPDLLDELRSTFAPGASERFDTVFQRRSAELNADRMAALDAYESSTTSPTVHGAIAAFIQPLKDKADSGDSGWRSFFAIVAMINNTPEIGGEIMSENFDPVVHRLLAVIRRVLPEARDEKLFWAYHCLSGGLTLILSQSGRLDRLSDQRCLSSDMSTAFDELVDFAAAGFIATCSGAD